MWPVQTLTLLLCLTEEEQLFAVRQEAAPAEPAVEAPAPDPACEAEGALPVLGA
jgi:hypothetical protein